MSNIAVSGSTNPGSQYSIRDTRGINGHTSLLAPNTSTNQPSCLTTANLTRLLQPQSPGLSIDEEQSLSIEEWMLRGESSQRAALSGKAYAINESDDTKNPEHVGRDGRGTKGVKHELSFIGAWASGN